MRDGDGGDEVRCVAAARDGEAGGWASGVCRWHHHARAVGDRGAWRSWAWWRLSGGRGWNGGRGRSDCTCAARRSWSVASRCCVRGDGRWASSDDGRVRRHVRRAKTHEVRCCGLSILWRTRPGADAAHDVLDELLAAAEARGIGVVLARSNPHPCLQALGESLRAMWLWNGGWCGRCRDGTSLGCGDRAHRCGDGVGLGDNRRGVCWAVRHSWCTRSDGLDGCRPDGGCSIGWSRGSNCAC